MASDTYSGSGGWQGGSPLQNTGQVLGSYMQKVKTYDPMSGGIKTATPSQVNTPIAASSLARVVNPSENQPAAQAAPVRMQAPVQSYVAPVQTQAVQAAPAGLELAPGRNLRSVGGRAPTLAAPTAENYTDYTSRDVGNVRYNLAWDSSSGRWVVQSRSQIQPTLKGMLFHPLDFLGNALGGASADLAGPTSIQETVRNGVRTTIRPGDMDQINEAIRQATESRPDLVAAYKTAQAQDYVKARAKMLEEEAAAQQARDAAAAAAAQDAADRASAFSLAGSLQAPNTSEVDAAGSNDLARVASQYAGGSGGVDSGFYGYLGQRDATTQASVNKVQHDTAYAKSVNANYNTFVTALRAQQQAEGSATAQKLNYDMQGVADALSQIEAQASQLGKAAGTKLDGVLNGVRNNLQKYQNAVKQYGADSSQAVAAAQFVLSTASSLATMGV